MALTIKNKLNKKIFLVSLHSTKEESLSSEPYRLIQLISNAFILLFYFSIAITIIDFSLTSFYPILKKYNIIYFQITEFIWDYFSFRCHQLPERSLFFMDYQLPVCNRCFFVLLGKITFITLMFSQKIRIQIISNFKYIMAIILPPLIIEAVLKLFFDYPSGMAVRSINGLFQGIFYYQISF